ncbi:hypothetical protein HNR39_002795 [Glaciimonas immobilis]|uniref:Uncharacterized protein n=1 Tax=Glaciimonas immobilis TaxID=728004 RepID=A0A840RTH9_9BURK|nr:hypothetical protein [Glaciimonas immobilis]
MTFLQLWTVHVTITAMEESNFHLLRNCHGKSQKKMVAFYNNFTVDGLSSLF